MAGKNTAAFGIYRTPGDVEYAVGLMRAEGFREDILERTGATDVASTGEARADWQKTDKPLRRAS